LYITIPQTSKWNFYERKENGNRPEFLKGTGNFAGNTYGTREKNCRSEEGHDDQKQIISLNKSKGGKEENINMSETVTAVEARETSGLF